MTVWFHWYSSGRSVPCFQIIREGPHLSRVLLLSIATRANKSRFLYMIQLNTNFSLMFCSFQIIAQQIQLMPRFHTSIAMSLQMGIIVSLRIVSIELSLIAFALWKWGMTLSVFQISHGKRSKRVVNMANVPNSGHYNIQTPNNHVTFVSIKQ